MPVDPKLVPSMLEGIADRIVSPTDVEDKHVLQLAAKMLREAVDPGCPDEGQRILALIEALKADGNFFGGDDPAWVQQEYERRAREILAALGAVAASPDERGRKGCEHDGTIMQSECDCPGGTR